MWESPHGPASASTPAPSFLVAVLVLSAGEFSGDGIQDNEAKDVRPQRIEDHEGECSAEQPDHPVFIMVTVKHRGVFVSTASSSPHHTQLPQPSIKRATGAGGWGEGCGLMTAVVFAGQLRTAGHEVVFPSRRLANLDQDVEAHEVQDLDRQFSFVSLHRGIADPEGFSCIPERPAFNDALDYCSLPI